MTLSNSRLAVASSPMRKNLDEPVA